MYDPRTRKGFDGGPQETSTGVIATIKLNDSRITSELASDSQRTIIRVCDSQKAVQDVLVHTYLKAVQYHLYSSSVQ